MIRINGDFLERLSKDKSLSGSDQRILWYLMSKVDEEYKAMVKQVFIAFKLQMSQAQVSNSLKKLTSGGYVSKMMFQGNKCYKIIM